MDGEARLVRVQLRQVLVRPQSWAVRYVPLLAIAAAILMVTRLALGWGPALLFGAIWAVSLFNFRDQGRLKLPARETEEERDATLGADGLSLSDRFIPRDAITKIDVSEVACVVTTRQGERIELRGTALDLARVSHFAAALSDVPRDEAGELILTRVDVAQLRVAPDAYRGLSLDDSRCLAIAEDPRADIRARVAAAELLEDRLDEAARERMDLAAEETAHSEVREALRASARRR